MIYFVGGGVGTYRQLTLEAIEILSKANIVLYSIYLDNSVFKFCKENCQKICFSNMERDKVDEILKTHCNDDIVYLANGDFACYGTVQDHFDFCRKNDLPFCVSPGVSSLGAVSAVLANELMLPNISNSLVCTYFEDKGSLLSKQTITEWAKHGATMAIFMAKGSRVKELKKCLLDGGLSPTTPVIMVQEALRENQVAIATTIAHLDILYLMSWMSLLLVGEVFADYDKRKQIKPLPFVTEFRRAEHYNLQHYMNNNKDKTNG